MMKNGLSKTKAMVLFVLRTINTVLTSVLLAMVWLETISELKEVVALTPDGLFFLSDIRNGKSISTLVEPHIKEALSQLALSFLITEMVQIQQPKLSLVHRFCL
jgi:hypothetical protein